MIHRGSDNRVDHPREAFRDLTGTPRFAEPGAFRLRTVLIGLFPLTIGSMLVDGVPHTTSAALIVFAGVVSLLAAVIFFLVGGRVVNVLAPERGASRVVLTLVVFGGTEALRTALFSNIMVMNGVPLEMLLPHRLLGGGMTGMLVIGIVSLLSADRDHYTRDYSHLMERQAQLTRELEDLHHTIDRFIDDLMTSVREAVDSALRPIGSHPGSPSTKEVVEQIANVSEHVVRPLSQEVSSALPNNTNGPETQPRISFRRVFELTTLVAPFQPVVMPLVIFMLFFSASLFLVPPRTGLALLLLTMAGVWLTHALAARFIHPRMPQWSMLWRIVVASAIYPFGFVMSVTAILVHRGYGTTIDRLSTLSYVLIIVTLVTWGLAVIPAIRVGRQEIIGEAQAATASLLQVRARNEVRLRRDKQRLSSIIHGDIQAILMATALKIQRQEFSAEQLREAIESARIAIGSSLEHATSPAPRKTLESVHQSLTDFWDGIVTLHWDIDPTLHQVVDDEEDLPETIFQVLREAITNSAKHGKAEMVNISLWADEDKRVVCRVIDNGSFTAASRIPGGGTQFFNAVSESVTLERVGDETVLTVALLTQETPQAVSVG